MGNFTSKSLPLYIYKTLSITKDMKKELIEKAKKLVKEGKVIYTNDAEKDIIKCNYSKEFLQKCFQDGILLTDLELYLKLEKLKGKTRRNYCLHSYLYGIGRRYVLIAWDFTNDFKNVVIFIHTSPCGGYEIKRYKELKESYL